MPRKASITDLRERKSTKLGVEESLAVWTAQRNTLGVDWTKVSASSFRAALALCIAEGVYIAFSAVQGGLGICLTLYVGETKKKVYASDAEQMNFLLEQIIDLLAGGAEDPRLIYANGSD